MAGPFDEPGPWPPAGAASVDGGQPAVLDARCKFCPGPVRVFSVADCTFFSRHDRWRRDAAHFRDSSAGASVEGRTLLAKCVSRRLDSWAIAPREIFNSADVCDGAGVAARAGSRSNLRSSLAMELAQDRRSTPGCVLHFVGWLFFPRFAFDDSRPRPDGRSSALDFGLSETRPQSL